MGQNMLLIAGENAKTDLRQQILIQYPKSFSMGILAYFFPFQPIRIQTCKHIVNILYRKAYADIILLNENVFTYVYIPNRNRNKF